MQVWTPTKFLIMKLHCNLKRYRSIKAVARPIYFLLILVVASFMISEMCVMIKQTERGVMLESCKGLNKSLSEIQATAGLLFSLNSSASNLARALSSSLNGTQLSFLAIQTKVAPKLFLALSTIPQVLQVSYIGLDGLLFSFHNDKDQTLAVYSNISFSSTWYTQPVNRDTGMLYGDASASDPMVSVNDTWFQQALNSSGYSLLGTAWNKAHDSLLFNTVAMDGRGIISLGFPTKVVVDHFAALDFHGGLFHLATMDGQAIVQPKIPYTKIDVNNGTVLVQMLKPNGDPKEHHSFSCISEDDESAESGSLPKKTMGTKYTFYCSTLNIAGVESVYVLAHPKDGLVNLVHRNSGISLLLLAAVFVFMIASLCLYIFLTARATKREMFLCAALIKQMEATQQAERKSMNKTKAYAGANHDVRGSLSAMNALIRLCQENARSDSELAANLLKMETCTMDLLGILNSILDMSKIEAGKTSLEIEEFNLVQLLEDVVDMYYPLGIRKGVDVVLDPCDGSVFRSPLVRGDRIKLRQILCNLVSNAIKFTSEGHVSIRAAVKKSNFKKDIIASNRTTLLKFLSQFCHRDGLSELDALHTVEENPNEMEFEFEVDDTGKGVPKDKQKSIFEDYVQVKETAAGQEGCGLGLGIVQSLVRVMKGELRIVEKESGERGTCFRFNVFLSTCEPESFEAQENRPSIVLYQHFSFMSPKPEGSHVIFFIPGDERRKVLKKYIESLNIKVTAIKQLRNFRPELEKIKRKLDSSCFNPGKTESSLIDYLSKSASFKSDLEPNNGRPSIKDCNDHNMPHHIKASSRNSSGFMLLVIDANTAANYSDFMDALANFRKDIPKSLCQVVWLDDPTTRHSSSQLHDRLTLQGDPKISRPLHGSRLCQLLSLLPERRGAYQYTFSGFPSGTSAQEGQNFIDINLSQDSSSSGIESGLSSSRPSSTKEKAKCGEERKDKALIGRNFLVVDDHGLSRYVTRTTLEKLGANVEVCTNGKEAFDRVCKALSDQNKERDSKSVPYHSIFMDCEMPVMNGYEATRLIRVEEEHYNVHIPIIALTANAMPEEASKSIDAGMDFHLTKPLRVEKLLGVIQSIHNM